MTQQTHTDTELEALRDGARALNGRKPGTAPPPLRKLPVLPVVEAIARAERAAMLWLADDLFGRWRDRMFRHTARLARKLLRLEGLRGEVEAHNRRVETKQAVLESPELRGVLAGMLDARPKGGVTPVRRQAAAPRPRPGAGRPRLPELARTPFRSHELVVRNSADAGFGIAWLEPRLRATFRLADGKPDAQKPDAPVTKPPVRRTSESRNVTRRHPARIPVWRCELRAAPARRRNNRTAGRPREWSRQEPAVRPFRDKSGDWEVQVRWEPP